MKFTGIKKFTIIGIGLAAMIMLQGCGRGEDEGTDGAVRTGMILIPGGTISGTNPLAEGESHCEQFYPATYNITVDDFLMDKYMVTKGLWDDVRNDPATAQRGYEMPVGVGQGASHPVLFISWFDAVKWLNARSELEGREPVYYLDAEYTQVFRSGSGISHGNYWEVYVRATANGYRLPTMDEWEYAARGGLESKRFPWGNSIDHGKANYHADNSRYEYDDGPFGGVYHPKGLETGSTPCTTPVDYFPANNYGLHDMSGNLDEWNYDWQASYVGSRRVIRGGGWDYSAFFCRVAVRGDPPPCYVGSVGFRAVLPAQ